MKAFAFLPLLAGLATSALAAPDLIANGDFSQGLTGWRLDRLQGAQGTVEVKDSGDGQHAAFVHVPEAAEKRYFIQLVQKGVGLEEGRAYRLSFRARSAPESAIVVKLLEDQAPYTELWTEDGIALSDGWKEYHFDVQPKPGNGAAVLVISGLAKQAGDYAFSDVSLTAE